jgi:polyferredoxin
VITVILTIWDGDIVLRIMTVMMEVIGVMIITKMATDVYCPVSCTIPHSPVFG